MKLEIPELKTLGKIIAIALPPVSLQLLASHDFYKTVRAGV